MAKKYFAYVGTNSVRGSKGIYSIQIDADTLQPKLVSTHQEYNTGTLALSKSEKQLYAGIEGMTWNGFADGAVVAYATGPDGVLHPTGGARSHGQRTCCVDVDDAGKNVYACNFYEGTFSAFSLNPDGSPQEARMVIAPPEDAEWKALHCIRALPGGKYLAVISLAECALIIYTADTGKRVTEYKFATRPFPRYIEVGKDTIYALMQDPGDIYVFANRLEEQQKIVWLQTISTQRADFEGHFGTTTVRLTPDGTLLLAATREANSLTVYRVQLDGRLALQDIVTLPGHTPRDFNISRDGRVVVTALQSDDELCVHRIDYEKGTLQDTGWKLSVPSPAAVVVSGVNV